MSEINDDIQDLNSYTGLNMDEIGGGMALGAEAGLNITPTLSLAGGFERMTGSTEIGDYSGRIELNLPANAFYGCVQYVAPSTTPFHIGFAAAMGIVSAAGEVNVAVTGEGAASGDVSGSGLMLQGRVVGEYQATPRVILAPSLGYRLARISKYEVAGQPVYTFYESWKVDTVEIHSWRSLRQ